MNGIRLASITLLGIGLAGILYLLTPELAAQPALPAPPPRPVPWGGMPFIGAGLALYAWWKMRGR